jgi:hypothetical protein
MLVSIGEREAKVVRRLDGTNTLVEPHGSGRERESDEPSSLWYY